MKFSNKFYVIIIVTIILYIGFFMISDLNTIQNKILEMNLSYLPIIVILAPISWFVIFLRWNILLKNSNISTTTICVKGGSTVPFSPPLDFYKYIYLPILQNEFGIQSKIDIIKEGYMPIGKGQVNISKNNNGGGRGSNNPKKIHQLKPITKNKSQLTS